MMESHDTVREGADPEDQTSGGSGGAQEPGSREDWDKDQKHGPEQGDQDVMTDRTGEPATKPGASDQTPSQTPDTDEPGATQEA